MQGPIWYRAAKYGTQQEAWNALNKLKAGVAHLRGENLLTVMFSNPAVDYFVAAVGYPSPSAQAQVEKLIPRAVSLSNEEITFGHTEKQARAYGWFYCCGWCYAHVLNGAYSNLPEMKPRDYRGYRVQGRGDREE